MRKFSHFYNNYNTNFILLSNSDNLRSNSGASTKKLIVQISEMLFVHSIRFRLSRNHFVGVRNLELGLFLQRLSHHRRTFSHIQFVEDFIPLVITQYTNRRHVIRVEHVVEGALQFSPLVQVLHLWIGLLERPMNVWLLLVRLSHLGFRPAAIGKWRYTVSGYDEHSVSGRSAVLASDDQVICART